MAVCEINEACLSVTHFRFDLYSGTKREDQDREKEDIDGTVYRYHRNVLPFAEFPRSTEHRIKTKFRQISSFSIAQSIRLGKTIVDRG